MSIEIFYGDVRESSGKLKRADVATEAPWPAATRRREHPAKTTAAEELVEKPDLKLDKCQRLRLAFQKASAKSKNLQEASRS